MKKILGTILLLVLLGGIGYYLVYNGYILLNDPPKEKYPLRGVDVSHYQGDIDWTQMAKEDVAFAFIKATEGSSTVDPNWKDNYEKVKETTLKFGAYHFFSFDSEAETQAKNFIDNVEKNDSMLPPVIDLEMQGNKNTDNKKKENVTKQLDILISKLQKHYEKRPIIYCTQQTYKLYLAGGYEDNLIWVRNVYLSPRLSDKRDWDFWQYTNRAKMDCYKGKEKFIDMNVFRGSIMDLDELCIPNSDLAKEETKEENADNAEQNADNSNAENANAENANTENANADNANTENTNADNTDAGN